MYKLQVVFYLIFFFSSRRRHTRSLRDWSSDVCSSDLEPRAGQIHRSPEEVNRAGGLPLVMWRHRFEEERSEERRVGKECRSGRWEDHEKEKAERELIERHQRQQSYSAAMTIVRIERHT